MKSTKSKTILWRKFVKQKDFDKVLIVLSATNGEVSIASFASVIGAPVGIASASFSCAFSVTTGIVKKLLQHNPQQKYKA